MGLWEGFSWLQLSIWNSVMTRCWSELFGRFFTKEVSLRWLEVRAPFAELLGIVSSYRWPFAFTRHVSHRFRGELFFRLCIDVW